MESLKNIGFSPDQIAVYKTLIEYGKLPASTIASRAKVSRVITYKILSGFLLLGIVEKIEVPKSIALFSPSDPENLRKLIQNKQNEAKTFENACESAISALRPAYNLLTDKPGIVFYEGLEGVKKVLNDSLYTESMIYSYIDIESVITHFNEINADYVKKREKLGIAKRVLAADTPVTRKYLQDHADQLTDIRLVGSGKIPFGCAMQIYDNKISYITIGKNTDSIIGVIIEDQHIADMHRYFFECLYETTKTA